MCLELGTQYQEIAQSRASPISLSSELINAVSNEVHVLGSGIFDHNEDEDPMEVDILLTSTDVSAINLIRMI
jgi:hypothetical protein